jgi:hypothetical protein
VYIAIDNPFANNAPPEREIIFLEHKFSISHLIKLILIRDGKNKNEN